MSFSFGAIIIKFCVSAVFFFNFSSLAELPLLAQFSYHVLSKRSRKEGVPLSKEAGHQVMAGAIGQ